MEPNFLVELKKAQRLGTEGVWPGSCYINNKTSAFLRTQVDQFGKASTKLSIVD